MPPLVREIARLGVKLSRLLRNPVYRRGLRHRVGAAIEHELVAFGNQYASVIDVGAGRGQFALFSAARFPGAQLYCLEPLPASRRTLERVAEELTAEIFPVAAASQSGRALLHVTADGDSSSLRSVGELQTRIFPGTHEITTVGVTAARLDEVLAKRDLARPVLLKIDVQGAELEVLRGAEALLQQIDDVLVECSFAELYTGQALAADVICHLAARGFAVRGLFSPTYGHHREWLQADVLFTRSPER